MHQELLGPPKYDSWVSRKADRFDSVVAEFGLEPSACLRKSWRSLAGKQRVALAKGSPSPLTTADAEWSECTFVVSTSALLAIVASIAARPKLWRCERPGIAEQQAVWIIDSIVSAVADDWTGCQICAAPSTSLSISRNAAGVVQCADARTSDSNMHAWVERHILGGRSCSVGAALLQVASGLRLQCRASAGKKSVYLRFFQEISGWLQSRAELSVKTDAFPSRFLELPDLYGPMGCRRKLGFATKAAVSRAVGEVGSLRSCAQVVAGADIGKLGVPKNAKEKALARNRSRNASKFSKDVMLGYLHAIRERSKDHLHANLQLDGSTFSGMDLEMYAFWNPSRAEGCWLPPMAIHGPPIPFLTLAQTSSLCGVVC